MNKSMTRGIWACGIFAMLSLVAVSQSGFGTLVFMSSFENQAGPLPLPEVGSFTDTSPPGDWVIQDDGSGNRELLFDDRASGGVTTTYLNAILDNGLTPLSGTVRLTYRLRVGTLGSPFIAGLSTDNPTSDFLPGTGPGDDGKMWVDDQGTGQPLPPNRDHIVNVTVSRDTVDDDWEYTVVVVSDPAGPSGGSKQAGSSLMISGTCADSAGYAVTGLRFEKPAGHPGVVSIDNIQVSFLLE